MTLGILRAKGDEMTGYDDPVRDGPLQGHNAPCCRCGERCDALAANPGLWPLILVPVWRECEPGVAEVHCSNCVHAMMAATREMSMNARDLHVKKLREQGFTWVQIGECLGMTPRQVKRSREAIAASAKVSGEKAQ